MNLCQNTRICAMIFISSMFVLISCSKKKNLTAEPPTEPDPVIPTVPVTPTPPVEKNPANPSYNPAFTGQTRISGAVTPTKIRTTTLTSSLIAPWGIASLPDGRFLVTEKAGRMHIISGSGTLSEAITGVPAVNSSGQGGLLGLCLDPDFQTSRMVYWSFSEPGTGGNRTSIAKGRLANDERAIEGATVIFRASPAYAGVNHYGGRVAFDKAGNLFVSTGERADNVTRAQAQSTPSPTKEDCLK